MSDLGPPVAAGAGRAGTAYVVEVEVPGEPVRRLPLTGTVEFGRRVDGVVLADAEASRRHFRLIGSGGAVLVEDLGSTNGTYVNKRKVTGPTVVHRGDQLQVGNMVMEFG